MKRWWVRWYGRPGAAFEYHGPWWCSGWSGVPIFVAAVMADDEDAAKKAIESSYDEGPSGVLEWNFVDAREDDWEPFCERFPRAAWMRWPGAAPTTETPR